MGVRTAAQAQERECTDGARDPRHGLEGGCLLLPQLLSSGL